MVQFRDKDSPDHILIEKIEAVKAITRDNIEEVLSTGVRRVAAIGGILGGGDPGENARAMRRRMDGALGMG